MVFSLDERKISAHFIVRYNLRNPPKGKGYGEGGVRDEALVNIYITALEQLYEVMTSPPWSRPSPIVGSEGKTIVNVINTSNIFADRDDAFTTVDHQGVPYICLPCGNDELTVDGEYQRAIAEAVHEATHVFNCRERPFSDPNTAPWQWMHEAMAVYMETEVLRGSNDFHRFLRSWVVMPENSLDAWNARYQAGMFLCYLSEKIGPEIINKIWTPPDPKENPLHAIERVLMKETKRKFSSPSPKDDDVFASGYVMDSYFLQATNTSRAGNVFQRHGERAVSESLYLSLDEPQATGDCLNHLACRYYRFYLESRITRLEVQLLTNSDRVGTTLKAELAIVTKQMQRGPVYKLRPSRSSVTAGNSIQLSAEIPQIAPNDIDHIVLVVSNCGFKRMEQYLEHDDGRQYMIAVTAH